MQSYRASHLEELTAGIFEAAGTPADIAAHVAHSLVVSNLMGHDSHGVIRIPQYLESIAKGAIVPAARPTVVKETATTAVVDGNWAFGQITAAFGTDVAIEKARTQGTSAVFLNRLNHIGRLGEYTETAAHEGMFAFMAGGSQSGGPVAPFGAAGRALGTNPLAFSLPSGPDEALVVDMATSVAAEGKLRVARAKGQAVAPGTIIDKSGNPTTDPNDFYNGGALLTFAGHKGYSLSMIAETIGRYPAGGEKIEGKDIHFGAFLSVVNLAAFRPVEEFEQAVASRISEVKKVRLADGFSEILMPGEPERRMKAKRQAEGVPLPDDTVDKLTSIAASLNVPMPKPVG